MKEKCTISIRLPEIQAISGPSQSMTWFILGVANVPAKVSSPISPCHLMSDRDPGIQTVWIFYSKTTGLSEILVKIVIVFLWQITLHWRYLNTAMREKQYECLVFPVK